MVEQVQPSEFTPVSLEGLKRRIDHVTHYLMLFCLICILFGGCLAFFNLVDYSRFFLGLGIGFNLSLMILVKIFPEALSHG